MKALIALIKAPIISITYVLYIPFVGFAVLLGMVAKKLADTFATEHA